MTELPIPYVAKPRLPRAVQYVKWLFSGIKCISGARTATRYWTGVKAAVPVAAEYKHRVIDSSFVDVVACRTLQLAGGGAETSRLVAEHPSGAVRV